MDWDKNGYVTPIEFKSYLSELRKGENISMDEVLKAFDVIDQDGSKQIQLDEFMVRTRKYGHLLLTYFRFSSGILLKIQQQIVLKVHY